MLTALAAEAAGTLTVELVLLKWNCEAWIATAHLPRKRVARAFLCKVLEIARADVDAIKLTGRTADDVRQQHATREKALAIIEAWAPRYMLQLEAGST